MHFSPSLHRTVLWCCDATPQIPSQRAKRSAFADEFELRVLGSGPAFQPKAKVGGSWIKKQMVIHCSRKGEHPGCAFHMRPIERKQKRSEPARRPIPDKLMIAWRNAVAQTAAVRTIRNSVAVKHSSVICTEIYSVVCMRLFSPEKQ